MPGAFQPSISFAPAGPKTPAEVLLRDKKTAKITYIALFIFLLLFVGIVSFRVYVANQKTAVQQQTKQTEIQLSSLSSVELEYITFVRKVQLLAGIQKDREERRRALAFVYDLVPAEDVLREVGLNQDKKEIAFTVETPDVFAFTRLMAAIKSEDAAAQGFELLTGDMARTSNGKYTMTATLKYGGKTQTRGTRS